VTINILKDDSPGLHVGRDDLVALNEALRSAEASGADGEALERIRDTYRSAWEARQTLSGEQLQTLSAMVGAQVRAGDSRPWSTITRAYTDILAGNASSDPHALMAGLRQAVSDYKNGHNGVEGRGAALLRQLEPGLSEESALRIFSSLSDGDARAMEELRSAPEVGDQELDYSIAIEQMRQARQGRPLAD